ncbi:hypothetical protein Misp01_53880 [Microtetraspora sp. NBRC 13810]|nr:hypothetical protein Misp01_53880 [Microtetraspora sp. NBRC 13810]
MLALGVALLAACSSEEQATTLKPLSVKEHVSSISKGDEGYLVNWAGVLANGNPYHFGEQVVATIVATDARGAEVARMDQPLDAVPPAATLAFSGKTVAKGQPAKVTISYKPAQWRLASRIPSAFRPFPVTDILTKRQKNGGYLVTGRVGNPYRQAASSLAVTALLRDKMGKLVGGVSTFVDDVHADNRRRFILTADHAPPTVATADVVARTWGSTSRPYDELAMGGIAPVHKAKPTTAPFVKDRGLQPVPGVDTGP